MQRLHYKLRSVEWWKTNAGAMGGAQKKRDPSRPGIVGLAGTLATSYGRKGESGGEGPAAAQRGLHGAAADW
jgi:hypothetical protein